MVAHLKLFVKGLPYSSEFIDIFEVCLVSRSLTRQSRRSSCVTHQHMRTSFGPDILRIADLQQRRLRLRDREAHSCAQLVAQRRGIRSQPSMPPDPPKASCETENRACASMCERLRCRGSELPGHSQSSRSHLLSIPQSQGGA